MPKIDINALDKKCVQKFQHYIKHWRLPIQQKQRNKPCFRSLIFFLNNILPVLHQLNMLIIIVFCLCPHELVRIQNLSTFLQKCSSIQDCMSSLRYNFLFTPLHLHHLSLCFCHHLHLYGWLYFCFNNILFPYVRLCCLCFHKMLFHNFVFFQSFNEHQMY